MITYPHVWVVYSPGALAHGGGVATPVVGKQSPGVSREGRSRQFRPNASIATMSRRRFHPPNS